MFKTLPVAFSQMPGGIILGGIFFVLVTFAAWTSAISLAEPAVAWMVETANLSRVKAALVVGIPVWLLGIVCALSQNIWSDVTILGSDILDFLDKLTTNFMLPLGGLLIAIFAGWIMRRSHVVKEMRMKNFALFNIWIMTIRIIAPLAIGWVMYNSMEEWWVFINQ
ncbi:MAG: hypothetical protein COA99_12155 [Moraxellaceae bacterium]|nr:MAG: hypothetical protein COA99_12155 [Moraxellaceae bacterium]